MTMYVQQRGGNRRGPAPKQVRSGVRLLIGMGSLSAALLFGAAAQSVEVYSETFDGPSVPSNWFAQNGSQGQALIEIVDDSGGIGIGNALSINAFTRQGVIGSFDEVTFENVGDTIQLSFDVRLLSFPNNAGGFRFGLYHDNGGPPALSSGYRTFVGTGAILRTTVNADGGDTTSGDILFGTNREQPPDFELAGTGAGSINNNDPQSFLLAMTRTTDGVLLEPFQNGVSILPGGTEHIPGTGTGVATPLQTRFNQVAYSTNGGIVGVVDNILVEFIPAPALVGDFNADGAVDAADYVVWRKNDGTNNALPNDNGLGTPVGAAHYTLWRANFGNPPGAGSGNSLHFAVALPEPSTWLLFVGGFLGLGLPRRRSPHSPILRQQERAVGRVS